MPRKLVDHEQGGTMYVTLKGYLARIEDAERARPGPERREVPTLEGLAREIGIHPVTLSNIANNKVELLNLQVAGRLITALRSRGFGVEVGDLLAYREK